MRNLGKNVMYSQEKIRSIGTELEMIYMLVLVDRSLYMPMHIRK